MCRYDYKNNTLPNHHPRSKSLSSRWKTIKLISLTQNNYFHILLAEIFIASLCQRPRIKYVSKLSVRNLGPRVFVPLDQRTCAIDVDCAVKPDGQNWVNSFVFQNGCSQRSWFLVLTKRSATSGDENGACVDHFPKILQNLSEGHTNVAEDCEDFRGRPEYVFMIHQRIQIKFKSQAWYQPGNHRNIH